MTDHAELMSQCTAVRKRANKAMLDVSIARMKAYAALYRMLEAQARVVDEMSNEDVASFVAALPQLQELLKKQGRRIVSHPTLS